MKEEECESVTELKSKSVKNSILEAMAKFKKNKEQMEKDKMIENCRKKPVEEKPKEEIKSITPKESELGITEYVHQGEGFSAIVKQRYSDFQVHEIDMLGNVVHLTDQTLPVKLVEDDSLTEEQIKSLSKEEWDSIENLVQDTAAEGTVVEFDVTSKSKEERNIIHKAIRKKFKGITSDSAPTLDGKTVMKVRKYNSANEKRKDTRNTWTGPPYLQFVLYKENTSTMDAISNIARRTKMKPAMFLTAGTKDKRAITSQLVTIKHGDPKQLLNALASENRIAIGNFIFTETPLQLGHLKGNRFRLALRNVLAEESLIEAKLNSLKDNGFINYYGAQRFGTRHVPTHVIGKSLLLGKWQEAVDLILSPPPTKPKFRFGEDLYMAQLEYKSSKNVGRAFSKINRSIHTIEGQLLFNLKKFNKDLVGALNTIPRNLRLTYIHAYQSIIWNKVVSKRVKKYGLVPIIGDLVYAPGISDTPETDSIEIDCEVVPDEKEVEPDKDGDSNQRAQRNQRKVIAIDSETINNYTIYDVLLPLPGYGITYPANEVAGWYTELLESDGLGDKGLKHTVKAYNLGGAYRLLMSKPQDVEWKFARYDNPLLSLVTSDWEKLGNIEPPSAVVNDGAFLSLILEFSLTSASYATMALREITKMETSAEFQTTLNQAAANKKPIEGESQAEGEPEKKRIKTEPDIAKNGHVSDAADAQPGGSLPIIDEAAGGGTKIKLERE